MNILYKAGFIPGPAAFQYYEEHTPWLERTSARSECFMSDKAGLEYTYGQGRGVRTYTSIEMDMYTRFILKHLNDYLEYHSMKPMNGVFLNRYENEQQHLGWHSDNFVDMDHEAPVCVISLGQMREIWFRLIGVTGKTPLNQRQMLEPGSLLVMPAGMQHTHEHRIPKGDREMGPRISLTFRRFK